MEKKYELTNETFNHSGRTLCRIKALKDFANVKKGDLGGFVEKEGNLSQKGNCWVFDRAMVYGDARVFDRAKVYGSAQVCDRALVCDRAQVFGSAQVCDRAMVFGSAQVCDDAKVYDRAMVYGDAMVGGDAEIAGIKDYIVFKNWWSSGRYFTWTRSDDMWRVGCFHGTGEELVRKAYKDSELSGREYKRVVNYVKSILEDR